MAHSSIRPADLSTLKLLPHTLSLSPFVMSSSSSASAAASTPKRILVVGTGTLGSHILLAIAARRELSASALVRPASLSDPAKQKQLDRLRSAGVTVVSGDSTDEPSVLADKLRGFDTVVCALSGAAIAPGTRALLAACKAAKVRRFVASEFGSSNSEIGRGSPMAPVVDDKLAVREEVIASGLNWFAVENGFFTEYLLSPFVGFDIAGNSVTAPGPLGWQARVATTPVAEIGRVVAELLVRDHTRSGVVRISTASPSFEELAQLLERVSGRPVKRSVRSKADIDAAIERGDYGARFAANIGVQHPGMAWEQSTTWNEQHGFKLQSWQEFGEQAIKQQQK